MNSPVRRRSRLLALLLAALLLGPLAAAQEQATETPPAEAGAPQAADDPVVLQVGTTVERASDIEWRFEVAIRNIVAQQGMPYSPEVAMQLRGLLPTYLEQRVQEVALVVEARRRGITPDEEQIAADLAAIRQGVESEDDYLALIGSAGFSSEEQIRGMLVEADIVNQLVSQLRAEASENVTEGALRTRYLADRASFSQPESFCARHILVSEEELAAELVTRAGGGEEFADLAAEYGTDGTRTRGGDLGCFGRGAMVADFEAAVVAAEIGVPTGPVATQFGFHALLVYDYTPARVAPFDEVRDEVHDYVVGLTTEAAIDGIIEGSGARVYPERLAATPPTQP